MAACSRRWSGCGLRGGRMHPDPTTIKRPATRLRPVDVLAVDAAGAGATVGVSRARWLKLSAAGRVPEGRRLGKCRRWSVSELRAWVDAGMPQRPEWERMREGER